MPSQLNDVGGGVDVVLGGLEHAFGVNERMRASAEYVRSCLPA